MIALELSFERRARVWFASPEEWVSQPSSVRSLTVSPLTRVKDYRTAAVVELFVPVGGRFKYGLLGATTVKLADSSAEEILIEVPVTGSSGPVFANALTGTLDTVRWGLPSEFAEAVAMGAREGLLAYGAPDVDRVQFAWAAYGYVGSSNAHFVRLARLVMQLLVVPNEANLRALVEAG